MKTYLSMYMLNTPLACMKSYVRGYVEKASHLQASSNTVHKLNFELKRNI